MKILAKKYEDRKWAKTSASGTHTLMRDSTHPHTSVTSHINTHTYERFHICTHTYEWASHINTQSWVIFMHQNILLSGFHVYLHILMNGFHCLLINETDRVWSKANNKKTKYLGSGDFHPFQPLQEQG